MSVTLPPVLSNSLVLYCASSSWMCFVTAGWVIYSSCDALVKLSCWATLLNTLSLNSDMVGVVKISD